LFANIPAGVIADAVRPFTRRRVTGDSSLGVGEKLFSEWTMGY
jgi:hypothetical protein